VLQIAQKGVEPPDGSAAWHLQQTRKSGHPRVAQRSLCPTTRVGWKV
jgi:hypothetical protein